MFFTILSNNKGDVGALVECQIPCRTVLSMSSRNGGGISAKNEIICGI